MRNDEIKTYVTTYDQFTQKKNHEKKAKFH